MSMFGKFGDMFALQRQAKKIKEELSRTHIEAEVDGVKVVVNASQEIVSVSVLSEGMAPTKLAEAFKKAANRGLEKAQKVAAERMKPLMGNMGFPGS